METGFIFQECQESHISDNDNPKPLCVALQYQENILHGQVSRKLNKYTNIIPGRLWSQEDNFHSSQTFPVSPSSDG